MQGRKTIKILATVTILVIICVAITYVKSDTKEVLATTKEFNSENLQENEHMHIEEDASKDKVPVPNGYVGSKATGENEIDTGYVIYEGEEEVNDNNVEEAQKTRNQYVWVPVPDASTMYGIDENGKKWGKTYTFTDTSIKPFNWIEKENIITIQNIKSGEPNIILNHSTNVSIIYDMDSNLKKIKIETNTTHKFLNQLEQEFNNMIESVVKYGGFYIGRYETGDLAKEKVAIVKGNNDIASQTWYSLYNKCKDLNNEYVETGIIWKSQWDRTLTWLIESKNKTLEEISIDSSSWGNYNDATFEYINDGGNIVTKSLGTPKRIPTGSSEYTRANNIYDLAGNVYDWTLYGVIDTRLCMGGDSGCNGSTSASKYTGNYPTVSYGTRGCRAMLYIK